MTQCMSRGEDRASRGKPCAFARRCKALPLADQSPLTEKCQSTSPGFGVPDSSVTGNARHPCAWRTPVAHTPRCAIGQRILTAARLSQCGRHARPGNPPMPSSWPSLRRTLRPPVPRARQRPAPAIPVPPLWVLCCRRRGRARRGHLGPAGGRLAAPTAALWGREGELVNGWRLLVGSVIPGACRLVVPAVGVDAPHPPSA